MDEKLLFEQMRLWQQQHEERSKNFWQDLYPKMSFEDKINYWRKEVYNNMQWQSESSADAYNAFNKEWLENHLIIDPDFEKILMEVAKRLDLDTALLQKRIR